MKNWKKIYIIVASLVIFFSLAYVFFLLTAKAIIVNKIELVSGSKVSINKLIIKPPLNIEIRDLEVDGLLKAGYIYLSPSIPNLLFGKIAFNKIKIINPEMTYNRIASVEQAQDSRNPVIENTQQAVAPASAPVAQNKVLPVIIKSLKVYSGRLNFIDSTAPSGVIKFVIKDIQFYAINLANFNTNSVSNFNLKGNISWSTGEPDGKLLLDGWADFHRKDISAVLKIENIDAIVFYPYYSTWVDLAKARIEKAKLNFNSKIEGKDNNIAVNCSLELTDIVRKVRPTDQPQQKAEMLTDAVLEMFKTMDEGKVVLNFKLNTKMDHPVFGFGDIKQAFEGKLMQGRASAGMRPQDMLLWPAKLLQSGIKSGVNLSNAAVDGVFALGNGIKKFFEEVINKPVPANYFSL